LAGERDAEEIASRLRNLAYSTVGGLSGTLKHLAELGIVSNGNDNTLSLNDGSLLDAALSTNLESVKQLFSDSTNGLAARMDAYLESTIGLPWKRRKRR
jgi:flagellar capping protein FliD